MSIAKASRVTEAKRHFVIAIDGFKEGRIFGLVFHMSHLTPIRFESMMDLVWIVEDISDEMSWPVSLTKQRNFKKVQPLSRKLEQGGDSGKVRRGKLATLKLKLNYRNYASWQGVVAWVDKEETRGFESFLELTRYICHIVGADNLQEPALNDSMICSISVDDCESRQLEGRVMPLDKSRTSRFRSILEFAQSLDAMMNCVRDQNMRTESVLDKQLVGVYYAKGKRANFVVKIRFCEHATWQGTIFWREKKQTINFRSFLELVKLIELATINVDPWTEEEKKKAVSE